VTAEPLTGEHAITPVVEARLAELRQHADLSKTAGGACSPPVAFGSSPGGQASPATTSVVPGFPYLRCVCVSV
jgi:hypothetical protein